MLGISGTFDLSGYQKFRQLFGPLITLAKYSEDLLNLTIAEASRGMWSLHSALGDSSTSWSIITSRIRVMEGPHTNQPAREREEKKKTATSGNGVAVYHSMRLDTWTLDR